MRTCPNCNRTVSPKMLSSNIWRYDCRHQVALWVWSCECGWLHQERVQRCPHCVGARPPAASGGS